MLRYDTKNPKQKTMTGENRKARQKRALAPAINLSSLFYRRKQ